MEAIRQQARAVARDLDEIKDLVCAGSALWALAGRLVKVKQAALRISEDRTVEKRRLLVDQSAIERVMNGYQADVEDHMQQLQALIERHGCRVPAKNQDELRRLMLAAENFAVRARHYFGLLASAGLAACATDAEAGGAFDEIDDLTRFAEVDDAA